MIGIMIGTTMIAVAVVQSMAVPIQENPRDAIDLTKVIERVGGMVAKENINRDTAANRKDNTVNAGTAMNTAVGIPRVEVAKPAQAGSIVADILRVVVTRIGAKSMHTVVGRMRGDPPVHATARMEVLAGPIATRVVMDEPPTNTRSATIIHNPGALNLTVIAQAVSTRVVSTGADSNAVTKVSADAVTVRKSGVGGIEPQTKLLHGSETERRNADDKWTGSESSVVVVPKVIEGRMNALKKMSTTA
jgi:hypothetical protein